MNEYILFMFDDATAPQDDAQWARYISRLNASGQFDGGSAIGPGLRCKKGEPEQPAPAGCTGYIRIRAESMAAAQRFLEGNPAYEAGRTVEVRELLKD